MSNWPLLSVLIWLPILGGALVLALGNARAGAARWLGFAVAVLTFVFSLGLLSGFDYANPGLQFIESHAWIPSFDIHYNLGADGIAITVKHRYSFETDGIGYYDGGVIELSDDGGTLWVESRLGIR